ncbi:MAG: copper transporter [Actinomycetota bacterium]
MIDFRYHLVSIVAVLLALSVGVILGTGALGGPLLEDIDRNVEDLRDTNGRLQEDLNQVRARLETEQAFSAEAEPFVLQGWLEGREVVVVEIAGTDGGVADRFRNAVGTAGGSVAATVEIQDRFALADETDTDRLALAIGSVSGDPEDLLAEAADTLGRRLAASLGGRAAGAEELVADLQEAGFVDIEQEGEGDPFPAGASVVFIGGSTEQLPYDASSFVLEFARVLGLEGVPVVVSEPLDSMWGLVSAIRNDGEARDAVSTADGVSEVYGRVAAVMALSRSGTGDVFHLGRLPGADDLLPQPPPPEQ